MYDQNKEMINGIRVDINMSYGCSQIPIRKNVLMIDDDRFLYQCGKNIIEYDLLHKKQNYIMRGVEELEITAMNYYLSKSDVLNIIFGVKGTKGFPILKVMKKNKSGYTQFVHQHTQQNSIIIDCCFIVKSKYAVSLAEEEAKYCITIYDLVKDRLLYTRDVSSTVYYLENSTTNSELFYLIGPEYLNVWRVNTDEKELSDQQFQYNPNNELFKENEYIIDISIIPQTELLAIVTNINNLHFFSGKKYLQTINFNDTPKQIQQEKIDFVNKSEENDPLTNSQLIQTQKIYNFSSIAPLYNGFIIGFEKINIVSIYEMNKKTQILSFKNNFALKTSNINKILHISSSIQENITVLAVQHAPRIIQPTLNNLKKDQENDPNTPNGFLQQNAENSPQSSNKKMFKDNLNFSSKLNIQKQQSQKNGSEENPLGRIDLYVFNYGMLDVISSAQDDAFQPVFPQGVHKGIVYDCAFCPSKSIAVTVCEDKTMKAWEFQHVTGIFKCVFTTYFHENPLSVDIQALGFQCAIGFREGLKFFFILEDELKLAYSEYNIKSCYSTKYSEGGNMLAVSNYNIICIYNHHTFECIAQLNGHAGYIKKIKWIQEDTLLLSNCSQGVFNCWNVFSQQRIMEHAYKQIKYTACIYDKFLDWAVCCSQDGKVKLFDDKGQNLMQEYDFSPYYVTSALLLEGYEVILFGMNSGSVRSYLWPLDIQTKHLEYFELSLHQSQVITLQTTPDLGHLVSGGDDGSFYVTKIKEFQNGKEIEVLQSMEDTKFQVGSVYCLNSLCLTSKIIEENKRDVIKELEFRISNLKTDQEDEKERQISIINNLLKKQEEKNNEIINKQKEQLSKIMEDCDAKIKELSINIEKIRNEYKVEFSNLEEANMQALLKCYQKKEILKQEYEQFVQFAKESIENQQKEYQNEQQNVKQDDDSKFQELFDRFSSSENKLGDNLVKYQEVYSQQKEEHLLHLQQIYIQLKQEKEEEIKKQEELRTSNSKKYNDIDRFNQRRLELESILKEAKTQIQHLEEEKENFIEKNLLMQKQLLTKEEIINLKEIEIKKYRGKNHHLQNFKTVYDYQVNTLKEERLPLIENMKSMENNVKVMFKELSDESIAAKQLTQKLEEALMLRVKLKETIKEKNDILQITQNKIENFEYDVTQLLQNVKFENWFSQMNQIYNKFFLKNAKITNLIQKNNLANDSQDEIDENILRALNMNNNDQIQEELIRQRDFMSKKIQALSKWNKQTEQDRDDIVIRVQNENTHLIKECNRLREERKSNIEQLGCLQKALDIVTKEILRITLGITDNDDQEFLDKQFIDLDPSKIVDKLDQEKAIVTEGGSPNQKTYAKKSNKTPFQLYEEEKSFNKQKRIQRFSQSLDYSQSPNKSTINYQANNQNLLTSLIKEMEKFQHDKNVNIYEKLKEKVQNYLYNEDPSLTIPHISTIDKTYAGPSIEETQYGPQHSLVNETLNLTKSQPEILSILKSRNNDSIVSVKNRQSKQNKSQALLPKIKKY